MSFASRFSGRKKIKRKYIVLLGTIFKLHTQTIISHLQPCALLTVEVGKPVRYKFIQRHVMYFVFN